MHRIIDAIGAAIGALTGRQFVTNSTCKAREDCLDAKLNGLHDCINAKFKGTDARFDAVNDRLDNIESNVELLIDKLIR